jgi:hypothetical protein
MLDRIDRFEQIRRRYQNVDAPRAGTDWQNYQVAEEDPLWSVAPIERFEDRRASPATSPATPSVASSLASSLRRATGFESQQSAPSRLSSPLAEATAYDGEGILRPVISRRRGAPGFALVDEQGAVLSFVTPARGVVLETHLGRKVGITGARGYMPEYRRPHLVAQQVAVLDDLTEQSVVNSGAARSTSAAATTSTSRSAAGDTPLRHRRY